jgi:DHA1 family bicyclomycin/chloramphenicol resistance-like MFS transporter
VLALAGCLALQETIPERSSGPVFASLSRLGRVLQNRGFTLLLALFSTGGLAGLAYIASSTYIYQQDFKISSQMYSFYFALNALGMISGPLIYLRIARFLHSETIIRGCYLAMAAAGVLVITLGSTAPWVFALCILPSSIAGSCMRAPAANLMLEQQKGDTGAVSSVMGCTGLLMGSLGMQIVSLNWGSTIIALGVMTFGAAAVSLLFWPIVIKRTHRLPGLAR